jgi:hypothetical protein
MFMKLFVYFYIMIQLPINCILMVLITYYMFEAQINYMWSLKDLWVKPYMLLFFILYVVSIFPKIVISTISWKKNSKQYEIKNKMKKIQRTTYIFEDHNSSSPKL